MRLSETTDPDVLLLGKAWDVDRPVTPQRGNFLLSLYSPQQAAGAHDRAMDRPGRECRVPDRVANVQPPTSAEMMSPNSSHRLAGELHQLQLLIGAKSVALVLILMPGSSTRFEILEVGGLLHDVFAGEIVAALLQHLNQRLGHAVAEDDEASSLSPSGKSLSMKVRNSFMPASFFHCGSDGSFR